MAESRGEKDGAEGIAVFEVRGGFEGEFVQFGGIGEGRRV